MSIVERIQCIKQRIEDTKALCRRDDPITLLAVSKKASVDAIKEAFSAGVCDFGESYLQEALSKIETLADLPICWHFIGPIQSNKIKKIASHFDWVHSVSRYEVAKLLNDARPTTMPPLNICLQVNLDNEASKSGVALEQLEALALSILPLPRLTLRGLMLIPPHTTNEEQQYLSFLRLSHLKQRLNETLPVTLDTLSMGMSQDMCAAVRAGSTIVRVGTAIFGARQYNNGTAENSTL